jgi:hypothetical protein
MMAEMPLCSDRAGGVEPPDAPAPFDRDPGPLPGAPSGSAAGTGIKVLRRDDVPP